MTAREVTAGKWLRRNRTRPDSNRLPWGDGVEKETGGDGMEGLKLFGHPTLGRLGVCPPLLRRRGEEGRAHHPLPPPSLVRAWLLTAGIVEITFHRGWRVGLSPQRGRIEISFYTARGSLGRASTAGVLPHAQLLSKAALTWHVHAFSVLPGHNDRRNRHKHKHKYKYKYRHRLISSNRPDTRDRHLNIAHARLLSGVSAISSHPHQCLLCARASHRRTVPGQQKAYVVAERWLRNLFPAYPSSTTNKRQQLLQVVYLDTRQ